MGKNQLRILSCVEFCAQVTSIFGIMRARTLRFLLIIVFAVMVWGVSFHIVPHLCLHFHRQRNEQQSTFLRKALCPLTSQQLKVGDARSSTKRGPEIEPNLESEGRGPSKEKNAVIWESITALLERAKEMNREYGVVLFTMINDAFLDFAASWCCNTASFDHVHQRVLFLTTDAHTARRLKSVWSNVTVAVISSPQFKGAMEYSKADYVRLMVERTRIILRLLEAGVQLLLFEVDSVWLKNPLPLVGHRQSEGDILATKVTGKDVTAGCFLLLNPTTATVSFWQELTRMMDRLYDKIKTYKESAAVSETSNDQEFFSVLARKKYAGIRIVYLPAESFPDGKWYSLPEKQRRQSRPFLINNNWIVGVGAKRRRAKAFGHWFWNESESKCNYSAALPGNQ